MLRPSKLTDKYVSAEGNKMIRTNMPQIMNKIEEYIKNGSSTFSFSKVGEDTNKVSFYTKVDEDCTEDIVVDIIWKEKHQNQKRGLDVGHEMRCELGICHPDVPKSAPMPKYDTATELSNQVPCTDHEGRPSACDGSGGAMHPAALNATLAKISKPSKRQLLVDVETKDKQADTPGSLMYGNVNDITGRMPCTKYVGGQLSCDGRVSDIHPRALAMDSVIDVIAKPHFTAQPFMILFGILCGMLIVFFLGKETKKFVDRRRERAKQRTTLPTYETQMIHGGMMTESTESEDEDGLDPLNLRLLT